MRTNKCIFTLLLIFALCVSALGALAAEYVFSTQGRPGETAQLVVNGTAQSLPAAAVTSGAVAALLTVESGDIRLAFGGATPTATMGHALAADQGMRIVGGNMVRSLQVIAASGTTNATLTYTVEFE